jgi:hypothetical protein
MDYFYAKQLYKPFRKNIKNTPYFGNYRSASQNRVPGIALSASNHPNLPIPLHNHVLYNIPKLTANPNNPDIQTLRGPLPASSVKHEKEDKVENTQQGAGKIKRKNLKVGQSTGPHQKKNIHETDVLNSNEDKVDSEKERDDTDVFDYNEDKEDSDEDKEDSDEDSEQTTDFNNKFPSYEEPDDEMQDSKVEIKPLVLESFLKPRFKIDQTYLKRTNKDEEEARETEKTGKGVSIKRRKYSFLEGVKLI